MPTPTQEAENVPAESGIIHSADDLAAGDRVVYPNQGVCRVLGRQTTEVGGMQFEVIALVREEDNASILVPVPKVPTVGLRKLADTAELGDVFDLLASSFDDPELDWKVRHRMHGDLLAAGGILGVAEVLKALQGLANLRPLPQKERERYDAARHLLVDEVAVALGVPHATAEDYIDLALIPPPGVERRPAKPPKLATLPPRPKRPAPARRASADEEEEIDELGLEDEELLDEEELPPDEEEAEAGDEEVEEAEDEEAAPAKKKPAAKKPAAKKAPAKKAATARADAGEKKAPAKKPAAKKAAARPAAKKAPAKKATTAKADAAEKKAPAKKAPAKKAAASSTSAAKKPAKAPAKKAPARAAATRAEKAPADKKAAGTSTAAKAARTSKTESP